MPFGRRYKQYSLKLYLYISTTVLDNGQKLYPAIYYSNNN